MLYLLRGDKMCKELSTGEKIKIIRKAKGLTQKELGKLCGMSESQIGQYESEIRNPKTDSIEKIAQALDIDGAVISWFPYHEKDELLIDMTKYKFQKRGDYTIIKNLFHNNIDKDHVHALGLEDVKCKLNSIGYDITATTVQENDKTLIMIEKKDEQADYINPMRQLETTTVTKEQLLKLNQETNDFLRFKLEQLFKDAKSNEK